MMFWRESFNIRDAAVRHAVDVSVYFTHCNDSQYSLF